MKKEKYEVPEIEEIQLNDFPLAEGNSPVATERPVEEKGIVL